MKILFFLLFFVFLQSNNSKNCVDCNKNTEKEYVNIQYKPTILYECAKNVKVYVQKYTCEGCGYFEVSVRDNVNKITKGNCTP